MRVARVLPLVLAAFLCGGNPLYGQSQAINGSIEGTITDPSGGVLPGVTVTLHHLDTGSDRVVVTNSNGDFEGWVQERGLYFFDARDPGYVDLLAATDPGPNNPGEKKGMLTVARLGRGTWTYLSASACGGSCRPEFRGRTG